ncbi:MAG: cadherin-like beta sandwich domain-containing protein, partial [Oscillospiraceae bacterium]|nr:cadherin-like beta sandwich domain-containing protein [Oscillospiraceae bacterium]
RHTLLQNGQNTVITVTVVSSDGRRRRQYTVTVCRERNSAEGVPQATGMAVAFPQGTALHPTFSPSIHNYEITVPPACSHVYLKVDTVKHTKVSVSRCTLQPAGRDTAIIARLTTDGGEASQYQVIVHRPSEQNGMTQKPVSHQAGKAGSTQKNGAGRRLPTSIGRKRTATRKAASQAGKRTRASRLTVEQQDYTPSAAFHTGAANGKALNVVGTEGFSGFQMGVLVVCLTAVASVLGVLGTRAWCRKHQNSPTKSHKQ